MQITNSRQKGQIYLIVIFELTITAAVFFFLTFPIIEQAKEITAFRYSYTAVNNAGSGFEITLFNTFNSVNLIENPDPSKIICSADIDANIFECTGKGKFTARTLFYGYGQ